MKLHSSSRAVGLLIGFAAFAAAQDPHNGFFLTSPLNVTSGWDQNFAVGERQLNDTETLLTLPTLAWMKSTHRADFSIDYQPEFEFFAKNPNLNAWNSQSRMRLIYRLDGRWSFDIGNYFVSTNDPTRVLANSLLLLPLGRFEQNSFYAGANYRLDHRTKLTFRVENTFTDSNGIVGPLAGRLDELGIAGTVGVEHKFNHSHELTGSYSFLHVDPLGNHLLGGAANVSLLNAGYTYTINPATILHLSIGGVRGTTDAMLGAVALERKVHGVWFAGGYQRYVSFFGGLAPLSEAPVGTQPFSDGVVPSSVYQVGTFRAWGQITKKVGIEAGAQRSLAGVNLAGENIHGAIFHARIDYRMRDRVVWFARAEYYEQNVPQFVPFPGARRRYTAGIEIALTRPLEAHAGRSRRGPLAPDTEQIVREPGIAEDVSKEK
jgi:hypothetical protein